MTRDSLTPEDLEYLQTRLVEHMEVAGCMPLDVAHGFLTATATGAAAHQPGLLERVLGGLDPDERLRGLLERFRVQLLHDLGAEASRARMSGLLIGAELAATRPYWLGQQVALIGARSVCDAYAAALRPQGIEAMVPDADGITLAGLVAARATMSA